MRHVCNRSALILNSHKLWVWRWDDEIYLLVFVKFCEASAVVEELCFLGIWRKRGCYYSLRSTYWSQWYSNLIILSSWKVIGLRTVYFVAKIWEYFNNCQYFNFHCNMRLLILKNIKVSGIRIMFLIISKELAY